jgi:enolase
MKLSEAELKIILDSRGEETLQAELRAENFSASASVPSGKSRGAHETFVLEPKQAVSRFKDLRNKILDKEFDTQKEFDDFLISLDGTPGKSNLGGNLILALSLAWARLKAKNEGLELFQYINKLLITHYSLLNTNFPRPIFNVIEGGVHARDNLEFQEFQIIPEVSSFSMALNLGKEFYDKLQELLKRKFGKQNIELGDESGFSVSLPKDEDVLEILINLIASDNYPLRIGLDAAASQFYKKEEGFYIINDKKYSPEELKNYYLSLIENFNILSIEDPFYEEDFDSFMKLRQDIEQKRSSTLIITDDLTTTNPERLKRAVDKKAGNAILIKPNQIGTLTETLQVVKLAYENNWQAVASHRSGETTDDFIADLAVGIGAWGIKSGAPATPYRLSKYERLLTIEKELAGK